MAEEPKQRRAPRQQDWTRLLLRKLDSRGNPTDALRPVAANAITILAHDSRWEGVLAYDEFAETIVTRTIPPWREQDMPPDCKPGDWTDQDIVRTQAWLADHYRLDIGLEAVLSAVSIVAARAPFHPVREWLRGIKWDGKRRVRTWLVDIMGCDDTAYIRECGLSFFVSAVARIMDPGCKVDTVVILEGEQGSFKSSTVRAIAGDAWFLEMSITDVANKDAMQVLKRKWICEFPEFDGFSRSEVSHVKSYCSRQVDSYRPSYGTGSRDFRRQAVFVGTTNQDQYLQDPTGARRFYPVRCRAGNVTLARELRDQLWAEALALYESGVPWHVVDPQLAAEFRTEQAARARVHPWVETIAAWLIKPIDLPSNTTRAHLGVTTADVLEGALKVEVGKRTDRDAQIVGACLRHLGWRQGPQQRRNGVQVRLYFPADHAPEEHPSGVLEVAQIAPQTDLPYLPSDDEIAALHGE